MRHWFRVAAPQRGRVSHSSQRRAPAKPSRRRRDRRAGTAETRRAKKRSPALRVLKKLATLCGIAAFGLLVLCGIAYAMTDIPPPNQAAQSQATTIEWRDGTKMATLGEYKRYHVELSEIPDHLEKAVLAAENRDFYEQPLGVSPTGIARAVWVNLTTDELQGGSTITQQFAQKMYLEQSRSLVVKVKELFLTLKLEQKMSKDEILEGYLNTVYFGRGGVYGVEAASREYFGKHVSQLTVAESAFLAAVLNAPANYDPANGAEARQAAVARWHYVIDGMVEEGWLTAAEARRLRFPDVRPPTDGGDTYAGPRGYILKRVADALQRMGYSKQEIFSGGLTVRTTLSKSHQLAAKRAVEQTLPEDWNYQKVDVGLVSIQPGTGRVLAMYGGHDYLDDQFGNVYRARVMPGSSFKPYVLAGALDEGIGLRSRFNGNSPQTFRNGYTVHNAGDKDYGMVNLLQATKHSVNTAYVHLGLEAGIEPVKDAATAAGLPEAAMKDDASLFLGSIAVRPIDHVAGIATFAAGGVYAKPHMIEEVRGPAGDVWTTVEPETYRAFSRGVAADVTYAMHQVMTPGGTGAEASLPGREAAGKTGTSQDNRSAWFVGFTPRVATVVAMFQPDNEPLKGVAGYDEIFGATLSAPIWNAYMQEVLEGKPPKPLPGPAWVGEPINSVPEVSLTPSPEPSSTRSPSPGTITPSPEPSVSESGFPLRDGGPEEGTPRDGGEPDGTPGGPGVDDSGGPGDECFPFCDARGPQGGSRR